MTRARPVPLRSLQVHVPAEPARPRTAGVGSGRAGAFAQLLRARRPSASSSEAPGAGDGRAEALEPVGPPQEREAGGQGGGDDGESTAEGAGDDGLDDWASSLSPSARDLDALLAHAAPRVFAPAPRAPPAIRSIADTIGNFANERAVSDSEGWNVRIVLRPDVLADTTLELGVSPHWLQVRFLTGDSGARALLYEHRDTLRTLLATALQRQRDIAIEID